MAEDDKPPQLAKNWSLTRMGWSEGVIARAVPADGPSLIIGIVDSGVDHKHPDLASCMKPPKTVIAGGTRDDDDHGTLLAGTIAFLTKNVPSPRIKLLSVKCCSQQVFPNAKDGAAAIDVAVADGARVVVLSWDCAHDSNHCLHKAISKADNVLFVVAAGNQGMDNDRYPNWPANHGNLPNVITVMATDYTDAIALSAVKMCDFTDERPSFSNYGATSVHLGAPGVSIVSTVPLVGAAPSGGTYEPGYRYYTGTSPATAHVAALAAVVRVQNPTWKPIAVKAHLIASAQLLSRSLRCVSQGMAHFGRAVGGPISTVSVCDVTAPATKTSYVNKKGQFNVAWDVEYTSPYCACVDITVCDAGGNPVGTNPVRSAIPSANKAVAAISSAGLPTTFKIRVTSTGAGFFAMSGLITQV